MCFKSGGAQVWRDPGLGHFDGGIRDLEIFYGGIRDLENIYSGIWEKSRKIKAGCGMWPKTSELRGRDL